MPAMAKRSAEKFSPWLQLVGTGAGEMCLVCVPPAGGGAGAFWMWTQWLPPYVDLLLVQPPAREERSADPPEWTLEEVRAEFARVTPRLPQRPLTVLGHSMGALIGTHIATWLAPEREVRRLIVSSYRPDPGESRFSRVFPDEGIDRMDPEQLEKLSGMTAPEWHALPDEFKDALTRRWFADLALSAVLPVPTTPVLDCPVTAWVGERDLMPAADLEAWSALTTSTCEVAVWPGGHDYLFARPSPVRERLVEIIDHDLGR